MSYPVKQRLDLFGFQISIENPKGSKRTWHDPHSGESGTTYMHHAYGYIRRTEGTDGDHVDVYVGPNHASTRVFIVNQMKKPDFKEFDEQKVMLGWDRPEDAKSAYLKQYNNPKFFGSMTEMPLEEFQRKVLDKSFHGKKIAGVSLNRLRALVGKEKPLFHLTGPANAPGLIREGKVLAPITARARDLLRNVETDHAWVGVNNRQPVGPATTALEGVAEGHVPHTGLKPLLSGAYQVEDYARLLDPQGASYHREALFRRTLGEGLGKNPASVSLSGKLLREYGDVGLLTSRSGVTGDLVPGKSNGLDEYFALPQHSHQGNYSLLPSAQGVLIYDPQKIDRATAKELKARGGIAIGGRLHRRLRQLSKGQQEIPHGQTPYGRKVPEGRLSAVARRNPDLAQAESAERMRLLQEIKDEGGTPRPYQMAWPEYSKISGTDVPPVIGGKAIQQHVGEDLMPFKSKRQQRAAFGGHIPGFSKEKAREWAHETPNLKKLPDRAPAEKKAAISYFVELNLGKLAAGEAEVPASAVLGDKKKDHPQKLKEYLMRRSKEKCAGGETQIRQAVTEFVDRAGKHIDDYRRDAEAIWEHAARKPLPAAVPAKSTPDPAKALAAAGAVGGAGAVGYMLGKRRKEAAISYFVELNLGKSAAGEAEVPASAVLGDKKKDQGIGDNIPPQTDFARAVEGDPIKAASESRASRIADHVDDVGLGLLGAPSAAYLTGSVLKRLPNAKAKALGHGLQHGVENLRHGTHHGIEAAGLALVSPTVSHAIAKKIDRALPKEKVATILVKEDMEELGRQRRRKALEKIASKYIPDFEYHTEEEKLAILEHFSRLTKRADMVSPVMNVARRAGHAEAQVARRAVAARAPTVAVSPAATQFGGAARGYGPEGAQNFYPGGPVGHVQRPAVLNQAAAPPPASAVQAAPQKAPRGYGAPAAQNFYPAGGAGHVERPASLNPPVAAAPVAPAATVVPAATARRRLGWGAVPLGAGIAVGGVGVGAGMAAQGVASGLGTLAQQGGHEPIYGESFVGPGRLGT